MSIAGDSAAIRRALAGLLRRSGISQSEMARRVGSKQGTVGAWYRAEALPSAELLGLVAEVLGVSAHGILTGDGPLQAPTAAPPTVVREYDVGYQAGLQAARDAIDLVGRERAAPRAGRASGATAALTRPPAVDPADALDAADVREQVERAERSGPGRAGKAS